MLKCCNKVQKKLYHLSDKMQMKELTGLHIKVVDNRSEPEKGFLPAMRLNVEKSIRASTMHEA